jgi:hypothetical protein
MFGPQSQVTEATQLSGKQFTNNNDRLPMREGKGFALLNEERPDAARIAVGLRQG